MTPAERAITQTMLWMTVGAAAAVPLLVVPAPEDPMLTVIVHLVVIVVFGAALTFHLAPLADAAWFEQGLLSERVRAALAGVVIVVLVTGAVGLITLATSAALRYDASLQFLQLISAMDIAWVVAAFALGLRWIRGWRLAVTGAVLMGTVCVGSIWRYLYVVGFSADGGWVVDGGRIASLVLPFDLMAAVLAITAFSIGVGRRQTAAP
jgi:hypothetical protein